MDETSTPATAPPPVPEKKSRRSPSQTKSRMPRPAFVAAACVLILAVGWGAFSISSRPSTESDDAELADLDGFETQAPSLGAPDRDRSSGATETDDNRSGSRLDPATAGRLTNWPTYTGGASSALPLVPPIPGVQTATFESDQRPISFTESASGAWLTGLIEADDAPTNIAPPPRVANGLVDGPAFR